MAQNTNPEPQQNEGEEIEIQHRVLIEEEELDEAKLPQEIQDMIKVFNEKIIQYEESDGDEKLFLELQQDDVYIADAIETFLEDEEAENEEEVEVEEEETPAADGAAAQNTNADNTNTTEVPPVVETPTAPLTPEEQVVDCLKDMKIKGVMERVVAKNDLERILDKEADYPKEYVGNLTLEKVYMSPFYRLLS